MRKITDKIKLFFGGLKQPDFKIEIVKEKFRVFVLTPFYFLGVIHKTFRVTAIQKCKN